MRSDMHEVIIERPRWAHAARYPRARLEKRAGDLEAAPVREAMGRGYRVKALEENLAPLRRFLQRRVGRPWSKVRSELTQHLRVTSAVQKHVMDHVKDYVSETAWHDEAGNLYTLRWGTPTLVAPITRLRFFVHPTTGLLTAFPRLRRRRETASDPNVRDVSPTKQYRRVDGVWFEVTLAPLPMSPTKPHRGVWVHDVIAKRDVRRYGTSPGEAEPMAAVWRSGRYASAKRQMSKREIRDGIA